MGVIAAVTLSVADGLPVDVCVAVIEPVAVPVAVRVLVIEAVAVPLLVELGEDVPVAVPVVVAVGLLVALLVCMGRRGAIGTTTTKTRKRE